MNLSPIVSVIVATYNHEAFIGETLGSIFQQQFDLGTIQVFVFDDGSTDRTLDVISEIDVPKGFELKVFESDKQQGVFQNVKRSVAEVKSPYVAFLDGDDKWTHSKKLQTQIFFLNQNSDFNGCFHDAEIEHLQQADKLLFEAKTHFSKSYSYPQTVKPYQVLDRQLIIPSSSLVLRSEVFHDSNLSFIQSNYSILWMLTCLAVKKSQLKYFDEVWSCYRNHQGGISKSNPIKFHGSHIKFLQLLLKDKYYKYLKYHLWDAIAKEQFILLHKLKDSDKPIGLITYWPYVAAQLKRTYYLYKTLLN